MKRIPHIAFLIIAIFSSGLLYAQQTTQLNCTQSLRTARNTYDQGRLHEVPQWLEGCLSKAEDAGGFTNAERIEAFRMLTLAYIYLEEPDKADKEMINLLEEDHFHVLNDAVDPIEFKNLYKKFRTDPVYRVGVKIGINTNFINVLENHYVFLDSKGMGKYSSKIGIQFGGVFEKDLTILKKKNKMVFAPELLYTTYSFVYKNPTLLNKDSVGELNGNTIYSKTGSAEHTISQARIQANLLLQYKWDKIYKLEDKFIPYLSVGPSVAYLMKSGFDAATDVDEQVTGPQISTLAKYKPITFSVIASAGVKLRLGGIYITADARLQYGLGNVVNPASRKKWTPENEALIDDGYVDDDFSLSQAMFNIGLMIPHFSPKKLIK